jgi:hypothetical protein
MPLANASRSGAVMPGMLETERIDLLIANQRRAVVWYAVFAAFLAIAGIATLVMTIVTDRLAPEGNKTVLGIGAGLVSAASTFPLKEVLGRRDKISVYVLLRSQWLSGNRSDRKKVQELIWEAARQIAILS